MTREQEIAALEREQFGLVTAAQLDELGLTEAAIVNRLKRHRHTRVRRGVLLSLSVEQSFESRLLAAVLAGGEGAFGSHESAVRHWDLPLPAAALLEITTDLRRRPRLPGVTMHRTGLLVAAADVTTHKGILVSTPARAIVDISARFDARVLGRLVDDALRRKLASLADFVEMTERLKSAPGRSRKTMRLVLARRDQAIADRESVLEDFVFDALVRFNVPLPIAQHRVMVNGRERRIDFCFLDSMVALEPKGFGPHSSRQSFDDDALRGNELKLAGYQVLEFTSAFTDWLIASQVARALGLEPPRRPKRVMTFFQWRDRLDGFRCPGNGNRPNGG